MRVAVVFFLYGNDNEVSVYGRGIGVGGVKVHTVGDPR